MKLIIPDCVDHDSVIQNTVIELESDPNNSLMPNLENFKNRLDHTKNLRIILEDRDDEPNGEQIYSMVCEKTRKVYEVKTNYLPNIWPKGYKFAVVKDQSVYEQLVKQITIEKYQRILMASITHEIRNPLNSIAGYSMQIGENNKNTHEYCDKIECSIQKIDFILTGACDLILSDNCILQAQDFNPKTAIEQIFHIINPLIEGKKINTRICIDENVPEYIVSDLKKYQTILFNLLTNAAKYTSQGEIIAYVKYDEAKCILATIIEDSGIGISNQNLSKLFELYGNIDNVNPYNPQGMNLGLAICKKLSKALGGDISAFSNIGIGSTFIFTCINNILVTNTGLGIDEESNFLLEDEKLTTFRGIRSLRPHTKGHIGIANESINLASPTLVKCACSDILIVDDDPSNRFALKAYSNSEGLTCDEAENGKIAINLVEKRLNNSKCCKWYKLILMDINMPEMDGTTATEKLSQIFEENKNITTNIIAVTAANLQTRADTQNLISIGFSEVCIFLE